MSRTEHYLHCNVLHHLSITVWNRISPRLSMRYSVHEGYGPHLRPDLRGHAEVEGREEEAGGGGGSV